MPCWTGVAGMKGGLGWRGRGRPVLRPESFPAICYADLKLGAGPMQLRTTSCMSCCRARSTPMCLWLPVQGVPCINQSEGTTHGWEDVFPGRLPVITNRFPNVFADFQGRRHPRGRVCRGAGCTQGGVPQGRHHHGGELVAGVMLLLVHSSSTSSTLLVVVRLLVRLRIVQQCFTTVCAAVGDLSQVWVWVCKESRGRPTRCMCCLFAAATPLRRLVVLPSCGCTCVVGSLPWLFAAGHARSRSKPHSGMLHLCWVLDVWACNNPLSRKKGVGNTHRAIGDSASAACVKHCA